MNKNEEIVFDGACGISIEEQKEILVSINAIAEKNRRSLADSAKFPAKKSGTVFPAAVNITAVVILAVTVFLLIYFNSRTDAQIRTGGGVYNAVERALIEEIRRDTALEIAKKEREIAVITRRLEEVDGELSLLYSSGEDIPAEQRAAQDRLRALQILYRDDLFVLLEERAVILEDSRLKEAELRARLEKRTGALAGQYSFAGQYSTNELESAIKELEMLTSEQSKITAADAQLSGGAAFVNTLIQNGQYDQASRSIAALRQLINSSVLS